MFNMEDIQELGTLLIPLVLLLFADAVTGAIKAWQSATGTFKWEWLYLFARTKGTPLVTGAVFLVLGQISPDMSVVDVPVDFFTVTGMGILGPLGISLVASIGNNLKGDVPDEAPQGAPPAGGVIISEPVDEEVVGP